MKSIGIKLADGSFYPILDEGSPAKKTLDLTTAHDNQTTVMVDLYRSETGTMEDAEYVDTLQIDNLAEHPNGEPDLSFDVSLDENSRLSAGINDPESGRHSDTTITLVSRTLEERMNQSDFSLSPQKTADEPSSESVEEAAVPPIDEMTDKPEKHAETDLSGKDSDEEDSGGLLAAAAKKHDEENDTDNGDVPAAGGSASEPPDFSDLDLPDNLDLTEIPEQADGTPEKEITAENTEPEADNFTQDFTEPVVHDETDSYEDTLSFAKDALDDVPEKEPDADKGAPVDETAVPDDFSVDSIDFDAPEEKSADTTAEDKTIPDEDTLHIDESNTDLPDFDEPVQPVNPPADTGQISGESVEETNFDMPDFDTQEPEDQNNKAPENSADGSSADDFSLPDFDEIDSSKPDATDKSALTDFFSDSMTHPDAGQYVKDNTPSNGIKFDGLYDKETKEGNSSTKNSSETSFRKKAKTPVLICVICALICVAATLLILFVIPSKYNLITMHSAQNVQVVNQEPQKVPEPEVSEQTPVQTPAPVVPEAKEDEVVVAPAAQAVVPEKPAEPAKKTEDIVYHIKWGDTLWDIADAYYKNPWRYHRIARYNHIKNPDYIISGTTIKLPAE